MRPALKAGIGSARMAVDYLLGERDTAGKPRDGVEVRRGDPDMVAAVADTPKFEHKYTSGVIAWAPNAPANQRASAAALSSAPSRANAVAASTPPMRRPATASSSRGPSTNDEKPSLPEGWPTRIASGRRSGTGRRGGDRALVRGRRGDAGNRITVGDQGRRPGRRPLDPRTEKRRGEPPVQSPLPLRPPPRPRTCRSTTMRASALGLGGLCYAAGRLRRSTCGAEAVARA